MGIKKLHFQGLKDLLQEKHKHDCIVVFYANWCHYCKKFLPILTEVSKTVSLPIYKIDMASPVNKNVPAGDTYAHKLKAQPDIAFSQYTLANLPEIIEGYPTTIFFTHNGTFETISGSLSKEELMKKIEEVYENISMNKEKEV